MCSSTSQDWPLLFIAPRTNYMFPKRCQSWEHRTYPLVHWMPQWLICKWLSKLIVTNMSVSSTPSTSPNHALWNPSPVQHLVWALDMFGGCVWTSHAQPSHTGLVRIMHIRCTPYADVHHQFGSIFSQCTRLWSSRVVHQSSTPEVYLKPLFKYVNSSSVPTICTLELAYRKHF